MKKLKSLSIIMVVAARGGGGSVVHVIKDKIQNSFIFSLGPPNVGIKNVLT